MKTRNFILSVLFLTIGIPAFTQNMTEKKLMEIVKKNTTLTQHEGHALQVQLGEVPLIVIVDEESNRMRIIAPVVEQKELDQEDMTKLLAANFHTALDAKYALANDLLWATYCHPLKQLNKEQLIDALYQVRNLVVTYGSQYASTNLVYGGGDEEEE